MPAIKASWACPVCGGKGPLPRDDKEMVAAPGSPGQCDPQSGGGLLLLSRFLGKTRHRGGQQAVEIPPSCPCAGVSLFREREWIRKTVMSKRARGPEALLASSGLRPHAYMSDRGLDGQWLVDRPIMGRDRLIYPAGELMLVPAYKAETARRVNVQEIKANKRPSTAGTWRGCISAGRASRS